MFKNVVWNNVLRNPPSFNIKISQDNQMRNISLRAFRASLFNAHRLFASTADVRFESLAPRLPFALVDSPNTKMA
jgi:hypothetical protein